MKPGRNAQFRTLLSNSASSPNLNAQFNVVSKAGPGLSIRGIAGPTTVQAQNFAPGTTGADIESAMTPIGGKILKCIIVATRPNVIAEIVFENREGANAIIDTFHNQTVSTDCFAWLEMTLINDNIGRRTCPQPLHQARRCPCP